jgi:perosamine synthetase
MTFVASANPVMYARATPVFVDCDPETWNLDLGAVEAAITERTRAIVPVHLLGNPVDMDPLLDLARKHNLKIIEDATESLGATYRGQAMATFGDLGCLSFNGNKTITTGGGGMVVGHDLEHLRHIKFLVNQAREESRGYYHPEVGMNYRMTNLEAALGLAQLERLEGFIALKREFHDIYAEELRADDGFRLQREAPAGQSSWWLNAVAFDRELDLPGLQKALLDRNIQTRRLFVPIVEFPPYAPFRSGAYPHAQALYERVLCLPSSTLNSADDIRLVCRTLRELL